MLVIILVEHFAAIECASLAAVNVPVREVAAEFPCLYLWISMTQVNQSERYCYALLATFPDSSGSSNGGQFSVWAYLACTVWFLFTKLCLRYCWRNFSGVDMGYFEAEKIE